MTDNPPIRIYESKIENWITFRIETGYYFELLIPETMKLLEALKNKTDKNKNQENVPRLEITKIVLVLYNFVNNDYSRVLHTFVPNKSLDHFLDISAKYFEFLKNF